MEKGHLQSRTNPAEVVAGCFVSRKIGRGGFEPPLTGPGPVVLPLDDLPENTIMLSNGEILVKIVATSLSLALQY